MGMYRAFLLFISLSFFSFYAHASGTNLLYSDDFESGLGNWTNVTSGDNKNWTRDAGGTPSYGTGPSSGAGGSSYYMYLETSSGSAYYLGDSAILQSPVVSGSNLHLHFQYHMYGSNTGTLAVDVFFNGNWINNVWSISGQQQLSNSAPYTAVDLDLSSYSASQIRFRATAAGGYTGDIAIDKVEIWDSPSGPVAPDFINAPLNKADAIQDQPYNDSIATDASDGNADPLTFSKISGPAWMSVAANGALSGTPQASDVGLNTFTVEVSDGALSNTATLLINVNDNSTPVILFSDDFELNQGNWSNVTSGDNKNWTRDAGGTPSYGTGPSSGAGGSSYYMYLETSSGSAYYLGDSAILQSPTFNGLNIHLAFKYHMYGSNIGTLAIDVLSNNTWINNVWTISGQQQTSNAAAYTAVDVDLSSYNITQVRFRATATGGYTGDIAIDDIELSMRPTVNDDDNDGVANALDQCPNTPTNETADSTGCSASQIDSDLDGVVDSNDPFPSDPTEWLDTDGDGIGNNADTDDDGDGALDVNDAFPLNPSESLDTDGDGIGNNADTDDDNDGALDINDAFPLDASESVDTDNDGIGNNTDTDDDNDGVSDVVDAFPLDSSESVDTDGDLIGNNTDTDDDNDGVLDIYDAYPLISLGALTDTDGDGIPNDCNTSCLALGMLADNDDDNDGVGDIADAFPTDPTESLDTDGDGIGNNTDIDDDNDGVNDTLDAFPTDPTETLDSDGDGVGNNTDLDDDNDGVNDTEDAFPLDASESLDSDGDGVGDNADAFPTDPTETLDTDGDGIGNNADPDDDNDGVVDELDAFPLDPTRTTAGYKIGGNLTGLNSAITLSLNGTESLNTDIDGSYQFSTLLQDSDQYSVSIIAMPTDQVCSIDNASGAINAADVLDISVNCYQASYTLTPIVDGNIIDQPVDGTFDSISDTGLTISPKSFGGTTPYNQRAIMEFDLSQLPPGIELESASLTMTAFSGTSNNTFLMHGYEGNGLIELSDANASETLADIQIRSSKPSAVTFDVTEYTNSLLSREVNYLGLSLRGKELANNVYLDFGASEYTQGAPTLTITLRATGERSQAHHWKRIEVLADGYATDEPINGIFESLNTNANILNIQYSWINYLSRYTIKRSALEFDTASLSSLGSEITFSRLHLDAIQRGGSSTTEIDLYGYNGDGVVTISDADTTANYIDTVPLTSLGSFFYDITAHMRLLQLNATPYAGFQIRAASEGRTLSTDDSVGIVSREGASPVYFSPYIEIRY